MPSLRHEPHRPRKPWRVDWRARRVNHTRRFATKPEAVQFLADLHRGKPGTTDKTTVRQWVLRWLESYGPTWESERTVTDRAGYADRLIFPHLGRLRLNELTRADVRDWRAQMVREGASVYTANRAVQVLSAALGCAVDDDLMAANPCRGLKPLPRRDARPRQPATVEEVEAIRAAMTTARDRLMVSLLAYAGLRPSEMLRLEWPDVRDKTLVVRATKTRNTRTPPIFAPVRGDLAALRADGQVGARAASAAGRDALMHGPDLEWHNWLTRVWRPARTKAGCPHVVPYALRHTYASLLIASGLNPWQVAALMGHSTPAMVISRYGHLFAEAELAEPIDIEDVAMRARHGAT